MNTTKRISNITAAVLISVFAFTGTAFAASGNPGDQSGAPHQRPPITAPPTVYPLCVNTQWRSHYWHLPLTGANVTCIWTPDMWLPKSWRTLVKDPVTGARLVHTPRGWRHGARQVDAAWIAVMF